MAAQANPRRMFRSARGSAVPRRYFENGGRIGTHCQRQDIRLDRTYGCDPSRAAGGNTTVIVALTAARFYETGDAFPIESAAQGEIEITFIAGAGERIYVAGVIET